MPTAIAFGALDGLSNFLSAESQGIKYRYLHDFNTKNKLRDFLSSNEGLAITIGGAIFTIAFSIAGNLFRAKDKKKYRKNMALIWPVVREVVFKAPKNSYSGIFGSLAVARSLGKMNVDQVMNLVFPLGIALGIVSAVTRGWGRHMGDSRKAMIESNNRLVDEIKRKTLFKMDEHGNIIGAACITNPAVLYDKSTGNEIKDYKLDIQQQEKYQKQLGYSFAAYNGAIDGMYRFIGPMGLTIDIDPKVPLSFSKALLTFMLVMAVVYAVTNIISYVYDEHVYQQKLMDFDAKVDLEICAKEFEFLAQLCLLELNAINEEYEELVTSLPLNNEKIEEINKKFLDKRNTQITVLEAKESEFNKKRGRVKDALLVDKKIAILGGLKNGMTTYGAMVSGLFLVSLMQELAGGPKLLNPWILAGFMMAGTFLMAYYIFDAWNKNHLQHAGVIAKAKKIPTEDYGRDANVYGFIYAYKNHLERNTLDNPQFAHETYQKNIQKSTLVKDDSFSSEVQQLGEVGRNLLYAPSKIAKPLKYIKGAQPASERFSFARDADKQSHTMAILTVCLAIPAGIIFMAKAIGKYFGRDSKKKDDAVPLASAPSSPSSSIKALSLFETGITEEATSNKPSTDDLSPPASSARAPMTSNPSSDKFFSPGANDETASLLGDTCGTQHRPL